MIADVHTHTPQHTWRVKEGRWKSRHGPVGGANLIEAEEPYRRFVDANGGEGAGIR